MEDVYPGAIVRRSEIRHSPRPATLGIVMHWTVGREAGDITVLDGPRVDCQLYVAKDGDVYQFLELDEQGWHGKYMANTYCIGIEHEGAGEPYTPIQFEKSARAVAYLCQRYNIPVRKVDPSGHDMATFRGIFGHRDLSIGGVRVDGNDHTDTVPDDPGWTRYLARVRSYMGEPSKPLPPLPYDGSMRVVAGGRKWFGWEDCIGPILWIARNGLQSDECAIAYRGPKAKETGVWRGADKVTAVCRSLVKTHRLEER